MKKVRLILIIVFSFFVGSIATLATGIAFAHSGDTSLIHGCVRNNGLLAGFIRIVGANTNCNGNETALDWTKEAGNNGQPITCPYCNFRDIANRFQGKDLTKSYLFGTAFEETNLSQTNFSEAILTGASFNFANLINTNFSNSSGNFVIDDADATGANFTNLNLGIQAQRTNLQNANFTNANLTNTSLSGATGMNTATLTGVTWSNTTCPDGTNSDNNGNTCIGHLTP